MDKLNRIIESYPPELKLLLVCCGSERWKAPDLLPQVDWERFLAWVKRHRVTPAVYRYIKKNPAGVPEDVRKQIEERFARVTKRNLLLASETIQICKTLESHGIKAIPLKGVFLAKQLYNDYNYRETRDIDILVDFKHIHKSLDALRAIGYTLSNSRIDISKKSFQYINHHVVFSNHEKRTSLELHWRLFVFKGIGEKVCNSIKEHAAIENETGVMLATVEDHMHFVIMHGHHHWWHALQWLVDVKDYIKTKNPAFTPEIMTEVEDIYRQTAAYYSLLFDISGTEISLSRKGQEKNICNSIKVLSQFEPKELVNVSTRLKRVGLFFDMNRNKRGFWREYIKYFWLKMVSPGNH